MKRWTAGLTASILSAMLLLGGCSEAPAGSGGESSEIGSSTTGASTAAISFSVTEISGMVDAQSAYIAFLKSFYEKDPSKNTNSFYFRDLDNNGVQELIFMHEASEVSVYTFDGAIKKIGDYDFVTGTIQYYFSDNPSHPGIFYFYVGWGENIYGYMTIRDNELTVKDLWIEDYAAASIENPKITILSDDTQLVEESKIVHQQKKDILSVPLESIS